jgi:hypothetical protein
MEGFLPLDVGAARVPTLVSPPLLCVAGVGGDVAVLETVLDAVASIPLTGIVSVGNHCLGGNAPFAVWRRLQELGAVLVRGPTDIAVGSGARMMHLVAHHGAPSDPLLERLKTTREQLGDVICRRLLDLPTTSVVSLPDLRGVMFAHGTPADEMAVLVQDAALVEQVDCVAEDAFVCGASSRAQRGAGVGFATHVKRTSGATLHVVQLGSTSSPPPGDVAPSVRTARVVLVGSCSDGMIRSLYRDIPVRSSRMQRTG